MRLLLVASLLVAALTGCTSRNLDLTVPWIVYADEAPVFDQPSLDAEPVGHLVQGDRIAGPVTVDPDTNVEWLAFERDGRTLHAPRMHLTRPHPRNLARPGDLPIGEEIVDRWWGIPLDYEPSDLVPVPERFASGRGEHTLRREACEALVAMFEAAEAEGLHLRVSSSYRSGPRQVEIYTRNIARNPAQRSSAPPGHSEHQLGTTVDLRSRDGGGGQGFARTPESAWLERNGARFGWVRSYYPHTVPQTGYISEPWHWRYHGPERAPALAAQRQAGAPPVTIEPEVPSELPLLPDPLYLDRDSAPDQPRGPGRRR
ncbi:MAG: M15 family metallopeptidase [Candidatus Sumerlaeia bacterium]|nr:M15 family metallopeptidase [Candidatus Sumerlaeia bacterium]